VKQVIGKNWDQDVMEKRIYGFEVWSERNTLVLSLKFFWHFKLDACNTANAVQKQLQSVPGIVTFIN
jgi:hypothetical protein